MVSGSVVSPHDRRSREKRKLDETRKGRARASRAPTSLREKLLSRCPVTRDLTHRNARKEERPEKDDTSKQGDREELKQNKEDLGRMILATGYRNRDGTSPSKKCPATTRNRDFLPIPEKSTENPNEMENPVNPTKRGKEEGGYARE